MSKQKNLIVWLGGMIIGSSLFLWGQLSALEKINQYVAIGLSIAAFFAHEYIVIYLYKQSQKWGLL